MEAVLVRLSGRDFAGFDPFRRFHALMDGFAVHAGVDNQMYDVNVLWTELARHRLCQGAKPEFGRRKCGKPHAATNARGRTGKEDSAAAARQHYAGSLAADQESAVAGKLPRLEEQLLGGIQQGLVDVRPGVEQANLNRPDVVFDVNEQLPNVGFLPGVDAERVNPVACGTQLVDQPLRLGRVPPADTDRIAALANRRATAAPIASPAPTRIATLRLSAILPVLHKFLFETY